MAHCSLPYPNLVFCSHLQCTQCIDYVDDDGLPLGYEDVLFPPDDCRSLSAIRNDFAYKFLLMKETFKFVDSLIKKANRL